MKNNQKFALVLLIMSVAYFGIYFIGMYTDIKIAKKIFEKMNLRFFNYQEFDTRAVQGVNNADEIYTRNGKQYVKDSGIENMNTVFVAQLDNARTIIEKEVNQLEANDEKIKFIINSGYRSPEYNDYLKTQGYDAVDNSAHTIGMASDINVFGYTREQREIILDSLVRAGFKRFGIGKNFIHVDNDDNKRPSPAVWFYSGADTSIDPFNLDINSND